MIEVTMDIPKLSEIKKQFSVTESVARKALQSGINRTLTSVIKQVTKLTKEKYTYAPNVKEDMYKTRASYKNLHGAVKFTGKPIPLDKFEYEAGTHGKISFNFGYMSEEDGTSLKVRVKRDEPFKPLGNAFAENIDGMKIFLRKPERGSSDKAKKRLKKMSVMATGYNAVKTKRPYSTDLAHMIESHMDEIEDFAQEQLNNYIGVSIQKLLAKAASK